MPKPGANINIIQKKSFCNKLSNLELTETNVYATPAYLLLAFISLV